MKCIPNGRKLTGSSLAIVALTVGAASLQADEAPLPTTPYMGGPVELVEAPNGAIANKRILDCIEEVAWVEPTIEQPTEGIWVFGGYGLAPISIIESIWIGSRLPAVR